ncbi:MAG: ribosome silencing factor [Rhodospirillum sp.]|nr:ribosome silencing factor [Rhodospirillum sp.]MCF8490539.1 ribosome silencing factor [Rhodospirillum sp.]
MERTITSLQHRLHDSANLASLVEQTLDEDKGEEIIVIDLSGKSSFADNMVIVSGRSARHVAAMADRLKEKLKAQGLRVTSEGQQQGDWVLLDAGDIVVHLFRPEVRAYYNLEKMWLAPGMEERPMVQPAVG